MRRRPVFSYDVVEDAKRYGNGMLVPCALIDVWNTCFLEKVASGERTTCQSAYPLAISQGGTHEHRRRNCAPFRMISRRERTRDINSKNALRQNVDITNRIDTNMP